MSCPLRVLCYNSLSSGFYPMRNNRDHIVGQLTSLEWPKVLGNSVVVVRVHDVLEVMMDKE